MSGVRGAALSPSLDDPPGVPVPVDEPAIGPVAHAAPPVPAAPASSLEQRLRDRRRNERWKNAPRRIEISECIGCDSCMRACPPQFGAVFNYGLDVVIVPELCSGCPKCVAVCPVDCIYVEETWQPTSERLWTYVEAQEMSRARG